VRREGRVLTELIAAFRNVNLIGMTNRLHLFTALGFLPVLLSTAVADTVLTAHVEITGATRETGIPVAGDYKITLGKDQATITSPVGKSYAFDFAKKTFTSINPTGHSYYQVPISEVLAVGNQVPPSLGSNGSISGSVDFDPAPDDNRTIGLALPAKPYRVVTDATLSAKGSAPGGYSAGYSPRGGLVLGGGASGQATHMEAERKLEGQLWMGNAPAGTDRDQLNTAFECVLLWAEPGMKELANKIHQSDLAILGAEFQLSTRGQTEYAGQVVPIVSIKITSINPGSLDPAALQVPSGYRRATAPLGPFGA